MYIKKETDESPQVPQRCPEISPETVEQWKE